MEALLSEQPSCLLNLSVFVFWTVLFINHDWSSQNLLIYRLIRLFYKCSYLSHQKESPHPHACATASQQSLQICMEAAWFPPHKDKMPWHLSEHHCPLPCLFWWSPNWHQYWLLLLFFHHLSRAQPPKLGCNSCNGPSTAVFLLGNFLLHHESHQLSVPMCPTGSSWSPITQEAT